MKKIFFVLGIVFSISLFLFSCKKDAVTMDSLAAYVPAGNTNYNVIKGSVSIVNNTLSPSTNTAFPAFLTRSFSKDVQVTAKIDTSLITVYNTANKTNFPVLPAGAFSLANNGIVTIKAGQTASTDSIQILTNNVFNLAAGSSKIYLVPVVLTSATSNVPVSNTRQVMYEQIAVTSVVSKIAAASGGNIINITLTKGGGITTGIDVAYLQASLNQSIPKAISIVVEGKDSLIAVYNQSKGTNYIAFPQGSYQLRKNAATILPRTTTSVDSITIKFPDLSVFKPSVDYLLPLKIKDVDPSAPVSDPNNCIVYIHVNVIPTNMYRVPAAVGTAVPRIPAWLVKASNATWGGEATNAIDDDYTTSWMGSTNASGKLTFTADMGITYTLQSLLIAPSYAFGVDYNIQTFQVLSSTDNTNWTDQGIYTANPSWEGSPDEPDNRWFAFYTPVTARYIRVVFISPTGGGDYGGMSEFNVYQ